MTRIVTTLLLSLGVLAVAAPSQAQTPSPQFTFTVPVRLYKLPPEIRSYSVTCMLRAGRNTAVLGAGGTDLVAVSGGTVNTDVVVNANTNTLVDPASVGYYSCSVGLFGVAPAGSAPGPTITYLEYGNTRFPLASGAPFRQTTEGPISR
jgi:hypothetical protein